MEFLWALGPAGGSRLKSIRKSGEQLAILGTDEKRTELMI